MNDVTDLPTPRHHTLLAVDVADFGRRTDTTQIDVRRGLYRAIEAAFRAAGIANDQRRAADRGDGALILISPRVPKNRLVSGFVPSLIEQLRELNVGRADRLRMRFAIHADEVVPTSTALPATP